MVFQVEEYNLHIYDPVPLVAAVPPRIMNGKKGHFNLKEKTANRCHDIGIQLTKIGINKERL